ncbi:hypothetical protein K503DRAFT_776665 [Rhizopogon vinicolor AM-OR11-026]|uniref:Uncharacterized protein n=1 Tax=Rhizopogon vinicolor AM-OR11-026 TaxID=1314800 RepID=A0A1B7MIJ7_9AGAM|nr:hypothetical protein K503DRAFT_776665 [Rhizopogon vinicolor AM-OR11-026]
MRITPLIFQTSTGHRNDRSTPPVYDTSSIHQSAAGAPSTPNIAITNSHDDEAGSSAITSVHQAEPSQRWAHELPRIRSNTERHNDTGSIPKSPTDVEKSLPECPPLDACQTVPVTVDSSSCQKCKPRNAHKSGQSSWLSLLPFTTSSRNTKQVRQSVLATIHDLIVSPSASSEPINPNSKIQQLPALTDAHKILASCAESCSTTNLSLSALLQEAVIAGHGPIYWAIVNYRPSLLDALLKHAMPLTPATLSEMKNACLVASDQVLFHSLRLRIGLCANGLRSTADKLLLYLHPPDDVYVEQGRNGAFTATLDIVMWQKRIRAVGSVSVEFIASGRIFALTFFTTNRPQPNSKSKRAVGSWNISLSVLEHSMATYVTAELVIDQPPPLPSPRHASHSLRKEGLVPPKGHMHRSSLSHGEKGYDMEFGTVRRDPVVLRLSAGEAILACRTKKKITMMKEDPHASIHPTSKPDTWSKDGEEYVSAIIVPLEEQDAGGLMFDDSPHLAPDGSLRARLEVRLVQCRRLRWSG